MIRIGNIIHSEYYALVPMEYYMAKMLRSEENKSVKAEKMKAESVSKKDTKLSRAAAEAKEAVGKKKKGY